MTIKSTRKYSKVQGIVTPCTWGDDDQVIEVCISTDSEDEFVVLSSGKGRELRSHLQKMVRAHGIISSDKDGRKVVLVKNYECVRV